MNDFTASNGIKIRVDDGASGTYLLGFMPTLDQTHATGSVEGIQALREFFQAEADKRLGRWRWPENPDYVIYPTANSNAVEVSNQRGGISGLLHRDGTQIDGTRVGTVFHKAARAYFDAHPEPKPLPDVDGIYAVSPQVHPYERLIQRRDGKWLHLRRNASEFETDSVSAEFVAQSAVDEGRLTRLVPEVS